MFYITGLSYWTRLGRDPKKQRLFMVRLSHLRTVKKVNSLQSGSDKEQAYCLQLLYLRQLLHYTSYLQPMIIIIFSSLIKQRSPQPRKETGLSALIPTYFLTAEIVSLFLNFLNRFVYVLVFKKTSENSCSSSALSFWIFRCSSSMWTSDIIKVSAFSNSAKHEVGNQKPNKVKILLRLLKNQDQIYLSRLDGRYLQTQLTFGEL